MKLLSVQKNTSKRDCSSISVEVSVNYNHYSKRREMSADGQHRGKKNLIFSRDRDRRKIQLYLSHKSELLIASISKDKEKLLRILPRGDKIQICDHENSRMANEGILAHQRM